MLRWRKRASMYVGKGEGVCGHRCERFLKLASILFWVRDPSSLDWLLVTVSSQVVVVVGGKRSLQSTRITQI